MQIIDDLGIDPIARAVRAHDHKGADYSASMLDSSPRRVHLSRRHDHEISERVSERIFALLGSAVHYMVKASETKDCLAEEYLTWKSTCGKVVSGTFDLYDSIKQRLYDFKTISVWQVIYGDAKPAWEKQLNTYAFLVERAGFRVNSLRIVGILRDWSKREASRKPEYPQQQALEIPVPLWSQEQQQAWIDERVNLFEAHSTTTDADLPECTADERWEKPPVFAVMKAGRKSAVKLHDAEADAKAHAATLGSGHTVVHRPGEWVRCADYCSVAPFCSQYQAYLKTKEQDHA